MITEEMMRTIQSIRAGRLTKTVAKKMNPLFPLKRTILCAECKKPMTGSTPHGNGGCYSYYHCYNKDCSARTKYIPVDTIEKDFVALLEKIMPTDAFLKIFKATVLDYWEEKGARFSLVAEEFKAQLAVLEKQKKRIYEMYESGLYTEKEFTERRGEITNKITGVKISHSEAKIEQFDIEGATTYASKQIANLPRLWKDMVPEKRHGFQKLVFPHGISYDRLSGFGTAKLGSIYELNRSFVAHKSTWVDYVGFSWNSLVAELKLWSELQAEMRVYATA